MININKWSTLIINILRKKNEDLDSLLKNYEKEVSSLK